jgi:hypothetical protein
MNPDVSKQFAKFAGKEVAVTETPWKREYKFNPGVVYEGVTARYDEQDPVILSLKEETAKAGFYPRIWMPGTFGTMDYQTSRLNVHIEKEADGKYRIQPRFTLG